MGTGVVKTVLTIIKCDSNNIGNITIGFICLMTLLLLVNLSGTKLFEWINNLPTIGKLGALVITIAVGLVLTLGFGINNFASISQLKDAGGQALGSQMDLSTWVMAIIAAFYAFTGFESVASGSEDMEKPEVNLPRAIPLAIAIIAVIYIGIVGIAVMVNPQAIVQSTQVVALADVFDNPFIRMLIILGALISMFGINVAASFHTPRILEAMAIQKQIPQIFAKRTNKGFLLTAFMVTIGIAILLPMAFAFNMTSIIVLSSISRFIQFIIVPLAVIVFYFGKEKGETLKGVSKNVVVDLLIPIGDLLFTLVLLYKFNWVQQFTVQGPDGSLIPNTFAITAMIIGYVILPIGMLIWHKSQDKTKKIGLERG